MFESEGTCNYRRKKWTQRAKFKSQTKQFKNHTISFKRKYSCWTKISFRASVIVSAHLFTFRERHPRY